MEFLIATAGLRRYGRTIAQDVRQFQPLTTVNDFKPMQSISAAKNRGGNGMDGGDVMMNQDEPGAFDNRLSLTPADFPVVASWRDGETYDLSELGAAKIRQISPGEFELIPPMTSGDEPEVAAVDEEANPAMDEMLGRYRA